MHFAIDEDFQRDGGVQFFYELASADSDPEKSSPAFTLFRTFDSTGRWAARTGPLHVLMSRIVYVVDKDAVFFSEVRANDVSYINRIVPDYGIRRKPDGGFRVTKSPSNEFSIQYLDAAATLARAGDGGVARILELLPDAGVPHSVVVQENHDFSRVLGWRTAEASFTWTAHFPLGPGRTRLAVFTMSYIHNLPPFFIGGDRRVYDESVSGMTTLVNNLRGYPATAH